MTHDEALDALAKELNEPREEIEKMICSVSLEFCTAQPCARYKELLAQPAPTTGSAPPFVPALIKGLSLLGAPLKPGAIIPVAPEAEVREFQQQQLVLPTDAAARNQYPMFDGLFGYFPNALAAIAQLSFIANEQHNPGEPMHWAIGKSPDHANKIVKHLLDHGHMDTDGTRHSTKLGWRALALLEEELVAAGAPRGRNAY